MKTKLFTALWSLSLLSGCMMTGMAGMGGMGRPMPSGTLGEDPATAVSDRLIVKEVVMDGIRVTADFPSFAPTESLTYTVTLRDLDGRAITAEASVFLMVSPAAVTSDATRLAPVLRGGGSFIFRPSIRRDGSYRLTVLVKRVGEKVMEPPLTLEQVVPLSAHNDHPVDPSHTVPRESRTPLLLLGAGLMAVMMIFSFR